ncbi:MAG: RsmG family class I SAM-dependent methyltransferase [Acetobacteraceae bacterium]
MSDREGVFPGLVLGIACKIDITLVESDQRKCAFLREAARACAVNAKVICNRIERVSLPPAPIMMARALAPLERLIGWSVPLLQPDGVALFLKGKTSTKNCTMRDEYGICALRLLMNPLALRASYLKSLTFKEPE